MAAKVVSLKNLSQEIKSFARKTLEQQQEAVNAGIIRSVPDIVKNSPVDTGEYANSWDFTIDEKKAVIGNYAPHAPIIEYGARPFRPPIQPLLAWAKRVLKSGSQPPKYDSDVWELAVGTQKKIEKYGMDPKNILENEIPKIIKNIRRELKHV